MTKEQAIAILDNGLAMVPTNRAHHNQLVQALRFLDGLLKDQVQKPVEVKQDKVKELKSSTT